MVEGAAALDVHGLAAHADAEGGELAGLGEGEDGEVEILAVLVGEVGFRVRGLAVEARVEVGAAGDEEAVEGVDHFGADCGVVGGWEEDGHAAGAEDLVGIVGRELEGFAGFVGGADVHGDADAGAGWGKHVAPL